VLEIVGVGDILEDLAAGGVDGPENSVVEVERPVLPNQPEVVGREGGETVDELPVLFADVPEQGDALTRPADHPVDAQRRVRRQEAVPVLRAQVPVDAPRNGARPVDLLAGGGQDDLLSELPEENGPGRQVLVEADEPDDVPHGRVGVDSQEKVGRREVEEMEGV